MLTRSPRLSGKSHPRNHLLERGVMLWRCIADDFEQMILVGKYENGERLPAESKIAARYGVNRHTVRRAMAELAARGMVHTERGSGSYVKSDKLDYRIGERTRFSEIMAAAGHEAEGRLQSHRLETADKEIAERLGLVPGAPVIRLEIVRSADRVPISVASTWLCGTRFHDAGKIFRRTRSVTRMLEEYGAEGFRRKWTRISAAFANAVDAGRLRLSVQRPILIVESVDCAADGAPLLTTRGRFSADRIALTVES